MPQAVTSTMTSSGPGVGSATSSSRMSPTSWKTAAFMVVALLSADVLVEEGVERDLARPRAAPGPLVHGDGVHRPPLAVVALREHRHQLGEVDDALAEVP